RRSVCDVESSAGIESESAWERQPRESSVWGNAARRKPAHGFRIVIGDIEVAGGVKRQGTGFIHSNEDTCRRYASGCELADSGSRLTGRVVVVIGDIDAAVGVYGEARGAINAREGRVRAGASRSELAYRVAGGIGDVEIAAGVER